jgi:L-galactose dehydrogenase/L-glyceraldehyde 3-phosphate reductase
MEYRTLGRNGPEVSVLGFGCGAIGGLLVKGESEDQRRTVARALDAGITYFDTAKAYGNGRSEEAIGPLLRELKANVTLGTKFRVERDEIGDATAVVRREIEGSLKRLGQDSVDLYTLHNRIGFDVSQPGTLTPDEVLGPVLDGLEKIRQAGMVRYFGFTGLGETPAVLQVVQSPRFQSVQSYVNAVNPSAARPGITGGAQDLDGLLDKAANAGVGTIGIRVLAAGALALTPIPERHPNAGDPRGALTQGTSYDADLERAQRLQVLASELGLESPAEMSYRFVISHPSLSTALVGASNLEQFEDVLRWVERGPLDSAAVERIVATASA